MLLILVWGTIQKLGSIYFGCRSRSSIDCSICGDNFHLNIPKEETYQIEREIL
jgi:hypothetical protein